MSDITEALAGLKAKTDQLNRASNELNGIIEGYERQIAATHVGLEAWVTIGDPHGVTLAVQLGWLKQNDRWGLFVRELSGPDASADTHVVITGYAEITKPPTALQSASRLTRIQALLEITALIKKLGEEVDALNQIISDAKEVVQPEVTDRPDTSPTQSAPRRSQAR